MLDQRYIANSEHFLKQVEAVWGNYFPSDIALRNFYENITDSDEKNLLLRVGSFYRFLVVEGKFCFSKGEWNQGLSYIDNTYKYIAIFSLIEALESPLQHLDFFQWLQKKKQNEVIETNDKLITFLEPLYRDYKDQYGATQAAVRFFNRLDQRDHHLIQNKLHVRNKKLSIDKLAQLLYDIRSEFLHQGLLAVGFSPITTVSRRKSNIIINKLTMQDICTLFEHGFLKRFGYKGIFNTGGT